MGGRRAAALPGPIEPDKSSLWMDLFSLDSVMLIIVQLIAIFIVEVDFSETYLMTSAENSISEPPNLKFFLGEDTPRPPYKAALGNAKKK